MTHDQSYAKMLDTQDPLARLRDRFAVPRMPGGGRGEVVYLCGNSLGLMPKAARDAVDQELHDWAALAVGGHLGAKTPWYSYHEAFREAGARLVGAVPGEVVMMNSLTVNLHLMMSSFYRPERGRNKILVEGHAFPSDRYAVASQAAWHGFDPSETLIVVGPRPGEVVLRHDDLERQLEEHGSTIAVVVLGGVSYFTGQLFDMARITQIAHRHGCVVGFDLAHAAGNVPLMLHDWDVDFAVWCSYKYLNGGPGAVAGCFVHERHGRDGSIPRLAGWWGNDPVTRFHMHEEVEFVPQAGAAGWQLSNPPILSMAPLKTSLEIFDAVGMRVLREKSVRLTGYLYELLGAAGSEAFEIITPADPAARGCQLSLRVRRDAPTLFEAITQRGVVADFRDPDVIRVAPTPLYNTFEDVWTFAAILRESVGDTAPTSAGHEE